MTITKINNQKEVDRKTKEFLKRAIDSINLPGGFYIIWERKRIYGSVNATAFKKSEKFYKEDKKYFSFRLNPYAEENLINLDFNDREDLDEIKQQILDSEYDFEIKIVEEEQGYY